MAERIYKELWSKVRNEKPESMTTKTWDDLSDKFFRYAEKNVRTPENLNGFGPATVMKMHNNLRHARKSARSQRGASILVLRSSRLPWSRG